MTTDTLAELPAEALERLSLRFPARAVAVGGGAQVSVRECGEPFGLPLVCLHGIGSGSASWL
ncbi:MAG: alpha/beta hydrolase, partial [Xenophilus sp.]